MWLMLEHIHCKLCRQNNAHWLLHPPHQQQEQQLPVQAQLVHLASKLHEASIGRLDVFAAVFGQTAVV